MTSAPTTLRARTTDMIELIEPHEHVPRLGAVRRAKDARRMQLIDDACGPPVADFEPPLQQRRRPLLILHDDFCRIAKELVTIPGFFALCFGLACFGGLLRAHRLENVVLGLE